MRTIKLLLVLLIAIALHACKSDKDKLPDAELMEEITDYAPLASIQTQKTLLESLDAAKILSLIATVPPIYPENDFSRAFALGRITADLMLVTQFKSTRHLTAYTEAFTKLAADLRLELQRREVDANLQDMYKQRDWQGLHKVVELLKQTYETEAWSNESYDLYTMYLLGQWIELTYILTETQIASGKSLEKSSFLMPELWDNLLSNMQLTKDQKLIQSSFFEIVYDNLSALKAAFDLLPGAIEADQLDEINRLAKVILQAFETTN